jgi:hypothetical protein
VKIGQFLSTSFDCNDGGKKRDCYPVTRGGKKIKKQSMLKQISQNFSVRRNKLERSSLTYFLALSGLRGLGFKSA